MKYKAQLESYFESHMNEILCDLQQIISIKSVADESNPEPGMPFGAGSRKALDWAVDFMEKIGMSTRDFEGYAVRGDFSDDEEPVLAVLAHLDTVPAGDESKWNFPPFTLTKSNGNYYGRGTIDDKGPALAALWSAKAIKELNIPVKNFRLIFGGNEEGGCSDMDYYASAEKFPGMVFTPDGSFPVLNCEKGMIHLTFSTVFDDKRIESISGGTVINAIPDKCVAGLAGTETIVYTGKASHGSRPENGENAITLFLSDSDLAEQNSLLKGLKRLFPHGEYDGKSCGLGFSDKVSGTMTCALTQLNVKNGRLTGGIDIRFPIDRTYSEISGIIKKALENAGFSIDSCEGMEPHYVDENSFLVQTLLKVYSEVKSEPGNCIAEGGITYVHNIPGGVAFGAEFPWENNNMHGADEHISEETFRYNLNMYANAICELCAKEE